LTSINARQHRILYDALAMVQPKLGPRYREACMAYKTILVRCNDTRRVGRIVGAAVELADRFQAHLVGHSVSPPVLAVPAGVPGTPDTMTIDERAQVYRRDNRTMKAVFQAAVEGKTLTSEWREEDAGTSTIADVVIRHAARPTSSLPPSATGSGPYRPSSMSRTVWPWQPGDRCSCCRTRACSVANERKRKACLERLRALGAKDQ
jgi:hypothetical protein